MKLLHWPALTVAVYAIAAAAHAQPVRIATWNLGWHVASTELPAWIAQCNKLYLKNKTSKVWDLVPEGTTGAKRGWEVTESRATLEGVDLSMMPPCAVYQANFKGVAVTANAYAKRDQQIAQLLERDVRPEKDTTC
ncbi:hypothetical protein FSY45_19965 [Comamonas sp. Z1]|uniref:hypothetical protein n=1 Tax=Comamonas sp. Z1 TaxID=2601246 RepID=UPI0011E7506C|nr:hypothetical protein [Comamonas sp. Z1]TYK74120.1 hypothetical protein FSY45_19965 [Comamonas sp. Z1]